ncbi:MAG: SRPBCC family protein [Gaiellaceae bacterium]
MPSVEESVEVEVPVSTAYNQWTQFEEFPSFMDAVKEVKQLDETHLHWVASIGGHDEAWDAEITEQTPDQRIAWKATSGKGNAGVVTFHKLGDNRTKIMLQLEWDSEGMVEALGATLGQDDRKAKGDLERFKELIEKRGSESGAWRGEVEQNA